MIICDKCQANITPDSKYCPQCGDPVTEADISNKPIVEGKIPRAIIEFGYSSSPSYDKAVNIVSNIDTYSSSGNEKEIKHRIDLPVTEVELLITIYDLVGGWKSSSMLIDGKRATKRNLTYYGLGCYRKRQESVNPKQYCYGEEQWSANIWGCSKLNMPVITWGGWLDYGRFDDEGIWHFDKDKIKEELLKGINENELCPVLNPTKIFETLDKLPNTINPKTDKNWEYKETYEEIDGEYKKVAKGITPIINKIDTFILDDFKPQWKIELENDREEQKISTMELSIDLTDLPKKKKTGTGCLVNILILISLISAWIFI